MFEVIHTTGKSMGRYLADSKEAAVIAMLADMGLPLTACGDYHTQLHIVSEAA